MLNNWHKDMGIFFTQSSIFRNKLVNFLCCFLQIPWWFFHISWRLPMRMSQKLEFFTTKVHKGFSQRTQRINNGVVPLCVLCALCG